jgi:hypothetical protein
MNHAYHRTPSSHDGSEWKVIARRLFGLSEHRGLFVDGVLAASYAAKADTDTWLVSVHDGGSSTSCREIIVADEATAQRLCRDTAGLLPETPLPAWAQDVIRTLGER